MKTEKFPLKKYKGYEYVDIHNRYEMGLPNTKLACYKKEFKYFRENILLKIKKILGKYGIPSEIETHIGYFDYIYVGEGEEIPKELFREN